MKIRIRTTEREYRPQSEFIIPIEGFWSLDDKKVLVLTIPELQLGESNHLGLDCDDIFICSSHYIDCPLSMCVPIAGYMQYIYTYKEKG